MWQVARLADICTTFTDGNWIESKDQSETGIRLIQTGNIGSGSFKDRGEKARFISAETFARLRCTEVRPGDCLLSRLPDPVGRSCLIPEIGQRMITAVDCSILRLDQARILPEFFVYYSQSAAYGLEIERRTTGTTRLRISRSKLGDVSIPLPPLPEQQRIVAILDEAFEELTSGIVIAEANMLNAEAAVRLALSQDFESLATTVPMRPIGDLVTKVGSGATPRGGRESYHADGVLLVRSLNVYDRSFRTAGSAYLDENQAAQLSNAAVEHGDVLLNITGASVARCCVAPDVAVGGRVNQHVAIIRPRQNAILSDYLVCALTSTFFKKRLLGIGEAAGSTRQALTKADLLSFEIPVPDVNEQIAICRRASELEQAADELRALYSRRKALFTELKQALLARAFAGKLNSKSAAANDNEFATPAQAANILAFMHWQQERANRGRFFGHVMAQKSLDLVERIGGVELGRLPYKDAAGPNDKSHMAGAEVWARDNQFFEFVERTGGGYDFKKLANYGAMLSAAKTALKPIEVELARVADILVGKDKVQAEVFATVLAAWNNLIIDGKDATDAAILREARDDWHPDKIDLPVAKFQDAIHEIRRRALVPDGTAKAVRHKQASLF